MGLRTQKEIREREAQSALIASHPPAQPALQPSPGRQIAVTIPSVTISFGSGLRKRLPLLIIIAVLFVFCCILFDKASFTTRDLFDMPRLAFTVGKLYSLSFGLFLVMFSLALAFAAYFGYRQTAGTALLVLPATLVPALLLYLMTPALVLVFVAFSFALALASVMGSRLEKISLSRAWTLFNVCLLILLIATFGIMFMKVNAHKAEYTSVFFTNVIQAMTQKNATTALATACLDAVPLDRGTIANAVSKDDMRAFLSDDLLRSALSKDPSFAVMSPANQTVVMGAVREQLITSGYNSFIDAEYNLTVKYKAQAADQLSRQVSTGYISSEKVKQIAYSSPPLKLLYLNFPLAVAVTVTAAASLVFFLLTFLAMVELLLLAKL
ncbi:Uncharacterised protein [Candidatus Norongarragalina meridionalis]|nr:Uncharacterised protein [Candidatus Norongarragalina meridionalis]